MDLLGVTALSVEVFAGEVKLGNMLLTSLFALSCHFHDYDLMSPSNIFAHPIEWGPAKVFPIGPRTC